MSSTTTSDGIEYYDGGAFAECFFVQYPSGLGTKPIPPHVLQAATQQQRPRPRQTQGEDTDHAPAPLLSSCATPHQGKRQHAPHSTTSSASSFSTALVLSHAKALSTVTTTAAADKPALPSTNTKSPDELATHVETTRRALEVALSRQQRPEEDFSGASIRAHAMSSAGKKARANLTSALVIHTAGGGGGGGDVSASHSAECGPVIRSPTKVKKAAPLSSSSSSNIDGIVSFDADATAAQRAEAGRQLVVPFSVSNWKNKKKLIIPVEQRLAQQKQPSYDEHSLAERNADDAGGDFLQSRSRVSVVGIGDGVMSLAMAMQRAAREVAQEQETREQARVEAEERQQTAVEEAEAARARQLLSQSAARLSGQENNNNNTGTNSHSAPHAQAQRETREQRLERIRLERDLRERERVQRRRQAMLERAAARMNISVAALEADASLLRTVEESAGVVKTTTTATTAGHEAPQSSADYATTHLQGARPRSTPNEDEMEEQDGGEEMSRLRGSRVRGGCLPPRSLATRIFVMKWSYWRRWNSSKRGRVVKRGWLLARLCLRDTMG